MLHLNNDNHLDFENPSYLPFISLFSCLLLFKSFIEKKSTCFIKFMHIVLLPLILALQGCAFCLFILFYSAKSI